MLTKAVRFLIFTLLLMQGTLSYGIQRFPKPEFESAYKQPQTLQPNPRLEWLSIMDMVVLIAALYVVSWLVIKKRSRRGVFWMSLFSVIYFGFYREGCICSVGSIQNVTLAVFQHGYIIPVSALVFFIAPLVFTLFFGRSFCAGVCPFGAIQDLVALRPQPMGVRLNGFLGLIPYLYLVLSVLYAATGTDFIICRYDPFVGMFRLNASFGMFVFTGILLASGIFLARPYCRFLCPYGVLLKWCSLLSRKHLVITPSACIQCRLCEGTCPYDAIEYPLKSMVIPSRRLLLRKFIILWVVIPLMVIIGGFSGSLIYEPLASIHPKVRLAKALLLPEQEKSSPETYEMKAFKSSGKLVGQAYSDAQAILKRFYIGGWILGGFMGLITGLLLARRFLVRYHNDYIPDKGNCLSCARCIDYCPVKS